MILPTGSRRFYVTTPSVQAGVSSPAGSDADSVKLVPDDFGYKLLVLQ